MSTIRSVPRPHLACAARGQGGPGVRSAPYSPIMDTDDEIHALAQAVLPALQATAGAYGTQLLDRVRAGTVVAPPGSLVAHGHVLLDTLLGARDGAVAVAAAAADLAAQPGDEAFATVLRLRVRKALCTDPDLTARVRALVQAGRPDARIDVDLASRPAPSRRG